MSSVSQKLSKQVKKLPSKPGVYLYKNKSGQIIYVGKAINLKKRVAQYFSRNDTLGLKTQKLVSQIADIGYQTVNSEISALLLESSLIKKHHPKYNAQLTDDKNYVYICISRSSLPQVFSAYQSKIPKSCLIYGPFPDGSAVRSLLKSIRRIFPYYSRQHHDRKLCLYCHLNLCPGPNPDPLLYRQNIGKIKKILSGNFKKLQHQLQKEMKTAVKDQDFETAIIARDQLNAINYIVSGWRDVSHFSAAINLPQDNITNALTGLITILKPSFPHLIQINRIECFDISQLGSNYFVGAMSVFNASFLDHSHYRQFKIKTKQTPDDQYMLKEVVSRRLKHPDWPRPDLILLDGGKPQVSAVNQLFFDQKNQTTNILPIIGLAKRMETIVISTTSGWQEINLPRYSHTLRLLKQLRDEAHRFANRYRRKLISQSIT